MVILFLLFWGTAVLFPPWLHHFKFSTTVHNGVPISFFLCTYSLIWRVHLSANVRVTLKFLFPAVIYISNCSPLFIIACYLKSFDSTVINSNLLFLKFLFFKSKTYSFFGNSENPSIQPLRLDSLDFFICLTSPSFSEVMFKEPSIPCWFLFWHSFFCSYLPPP